jgi:hypothetical protein
MERERIRDVLITASGEAINCAAPSLQAGINSAIVQLLGSEIAGRGAGTRDEWASLGKELVARYGVPATQCGLDIAWRKLRELAPSGSPRRTLEALSSVRPAPATVNPGTLDVVAWLRAHQQEWAGD